MIIKLKDMILEAHQIVSENFGYLVKKENIKLEVYRIGKINAYINNVCYESFYGDWIIMNKSIGFYMVISQEKFDKLKNFMQIKNLEKELSKFPDEEYPKVAYSIPINTASCDPQRIYNENLFTKKNIEDIMRGEVRYEHES